VRGGPSDVITPIREITMQRRGTPQPVLGQREGSPDPAGADESSRRPVGRVAESGPSRSRTWFREPKAAVWLVLAAVVLIGGGRRLRWAWRARKAVAHLEKPGATPEQIEAVAEFGRAGAWELLRIFSSGESDACRIAAGRALARLWRDDQLVAEEEQAVLRRGFSVTWSARRRYPRSLHAAIPISVVYEVPFLPEDGHHVGPNDLEWSHRVLGARRAALEEFTLWTAGPGRFGFSIIPDDFPTNGPHRLVLQVRVRPVGLSSSWEIELPHVPFTFEFDPILRLEAILTLPDTHRDESIARAINLEPVSSAPDLPAARLPLGGEWILRNPPRLAVTTPLPCDLAHGLSMEFDGTPGRFPAGSLIVSGQGLPHREPSDAGTTGRRLDLGPVQPIPAGVIERPGLRRMRVRLVADPELGWADPDVRSVWPGEMTTNWVEAEIVRL
jgi:hypothetical protein